MAPERAHGQRNWGTGQHVVWADAGYNVQETTVNTRHVSKYLWTKARKELFKQNIKNKQGENYSKLACIKIKGSRDPSAGMRGSVEQGHPHTGQEQVYRSSHLAPLRLCLLSPRPPTGPRCRVGVQASPGCGVNAAFWGSTQEHTGQQRMCSAHGNAQEEGVGRAWPGGAEVTAHPPLNQGSPGSTPQSSHHTKAKC